MGEILKAEIFRIQYQAGLEKEFTVGINDNDCSSFSFDDLREFLKSHGMTIVKCNECEVVHCNCYG